ncbi:uncharacterized protein TNCV_4436421 [Trichonephila clavipes]|nr:uncharacterized protein TNCV_4436421 [Trichonephila clavipes]
MTPELVPPLLTTTLHQVEDVSALDRFNVHRCPTRRVFICTGFELVTRQASIQFLYHSSTATTNKMPMALGVPRFSPSQVLSTPDDAYLR